MKKSRLGRARIEPHQYERIIGMVVDGLGVCKFSDAPNALYGPRNLAGCALDAAAGRGDAAARAAAKREAPVGARMAGVRPPSGEWIRLSTRDAAPDGAVGALRGFNGAAAPVLRRSGGLGEKAGAAIDFHKIPRHDKKPGPWPARGGDKASKSKASCEAYSTVQCLAGGRGSPRACGRTRAPTTSPGPCAPRPPTAAGAACGWERP